MYLSHVNVRMTLFYTFASYSRLAQQKTSVFSHLLCIQSVAVCCFI